MRESLPIAGETEFVVIRGDASGFIAPAASARKVALDMTDESGVNVFSAISTLMPVQAMVIQRAQVKNPWRSEHPTEFSELEQEVVRLAKSGEPQKVIEYRPVVREYWAPFNYPNVRVELGRTDPYVGAEFNMDGVELDVPPYGAITVVEEEPIVGVTVIGSACCPPGFVILWAEPMEWKYPRSGVKMRIDNLLGEHMRIEPWKKGLDEAYRDAGMSCAVFELPESRKVTIMAGSQMNIDERDIENMRHDAHYCIRIIRVTVKRDL